MSNSVLTDRPSYRSFVTDRAELSEQYGPAMGYSVSIEALPLRICKHFPTIAAAKVWAKANANGAHFSIGRETLNECLSITVGATTEKTFLLSGVCEVTTFRRVVAGAKRRAATPAWLSKLAQLA